MRTLPLILLLAACAAASDKNWPSLARRPAEAIATGLATAPAQATVAPAAEAPPSPPSTIATARLSQAERDLGALEERYAKQRATTETAVAAARGGARNSDAWASAQVELSRLGKLGAQADATRERLDGIAGELAQAAAGGADVAAPLAATGKLIERTEGLRARHAESEKALALPN